MEHINEIDIEREQKKNDGLLLRVAFVFGLYLAIFILVIVMIILVRNVEEIKSDPISYGITQKGFLACRCQDDQNRVYYYAGNRSLSITDYYSMINEEDPTKKCPTLEKINFTELNLTID